ncbi:nuclear transport factor 2 family protein [Pseudomonas capeferrum]|uniref:nuclear transport factor 2 family protein n=1 Tax=Pseudomonas capeferrum TaxID=1495066 RepID=UPI0015E339A7|nr:nuclear transport factor 2 family protein [Pseudomonas capeferrum]MBA1200418.1 nuclear transport factor 2 family protein [Pseudomonas capeferrum]
MQTSANKQLVLDYLQHMEAGNTLAALALTSDDARFWMPGPGELNKAQIAGFFEQVSPLILNMRFTIHGIAEEGERVAVEASGLARLANGKPYANEYHFLFIVNDGRIVVMKEYADTAPAAVFFES